MPCRLWFRRSRGAGHAAEESARGQVAVAANQVGVILSRIYIHIYIYMCIYIHIGDMFSLIDPRVRVLEVRGHLRISVGPHGDAVRVLSGGAVELGG